MNAARTILECKCIFHARCFHFLKRNSCPKCKATVNISYPLDFGDDIATAEKLRAYLKSMRRPVRQVRDDLVGRISLATTIAMASVETSVSVLLKQNVPVSFLKERNITIKDVLETGMSYAELLRVGYTPEDFVELGADWDDFLNMGIDSHHVGDIGIFTLQKDLRVTYPVLRNSLDDVPSL